MYGCDVYYDEQTGPCVAGNNKTLAPVTATPHAQPIAAPVYFITFEVFSSLIILNLARQATEFHTRYFRHRSP